MKQQEDKSIKIQQYLANQMNAQEAKAFEKAIAKDKSLAQEVNLYTEMEDFFSNTTERALRKNLQKLGDDYVPASSGIANTWKYVVAFLLVGFTGGVWFLLTKDSDKKEGFEENKNTALIETPEDKKLPVIDIEPTSTPPMEEELDVLKDYTKPKVTDPIKEKETTTSKKYQPIAANFEISTALDFLVENNLRSAESEFIVRNKQTNQLIQSLSDAVSFSFVALLKTEADIKRHDFKLYVFSNKSSDFDDFAPLYTFDIQATPSQGDNYQLVMSRKLALEPGLYYYLLEDQAAEKIYFVDKFEVNFQ